MSDITDCKKEMDLLAKQLEIKDLKKRLSDDQEVNKYERDEFIHQASKQMLESGEYDRKTIVKVRESLMNNPNR